MSAVIETIIVCDGGVECKTKGCFGDGDHRHHTAKQQRGMYKNSNEKEIWVYHKGKDYCPACAARLGITM